MSHTTLAHVLTMSFPELSVSAYCLVCLPPITEQPLVTMENGEQGHQELHNYWKRKQGCLGQLLEKGTEGPKGLGHNNFRKRELGGLGLNDSWKRELRVTTTFVKCTNFIWVNILISI